MNGVSVGVGVRVEVGTGDWVGVAVEATLSETLVGVSESVAVSVTGWVISGKTCGLGRVPAQPEITQAKIRTAQRCAPLIPGNV